MRKLLKLVAIGALFAVGPIPAFAVGTDVQLFFNPDGGGTCFASSSCIPEGFLPINVWDKLALNPIQNGSNLTLLFTNVPSPGSDLITGTGAGTGPGANPFGSTPALFATFIEGSGGGDRLVTGGTLFPPLFTSVPWTGSNLLYTWSNVTGVTPGTYTLFLYEGTTGTGEHNISDVLSVQVIPEPEIYAMMAIGLALMGFVARRRRGQAAAA